MSVPTRIRLGSAVVAMLALAACGSGKSTSPTPASPSSGPSPTASASPAGSDGPGFVEPFDNNDNDWPMQSAPDGTKLAVADGEYRITLPAGSIRYIRPAALAQRTDVRRNIAISGKVTVISGKTYAYGLACRMSPSDKQYYIGRLFENGTSAITRREKGKGERILKSSRANPVTLAQGQPVQLELRCGEKAGSLQLALSVNGRTAVEVADPSPLPENPPGIYAVAGLDAVTSTFAFDDIRVGPYSP